MCSALSFSFWAHALLAALVASAFWTRAFFAVSLAVVLSFCFSTRVFLAAFPGLEDTRFRGDLVELDKLPIRASVTDCWLPFFLCLVDLPSVGRRGGYRVAGAAVMALFIPSLVFAILMRSKVGISMFYYGVKLKTLGVTIRRIVLSDLVWCIH